MLWLKIAFHFLKIESVMTHDFYVSLNFLVYVYRTRETVIFLPKSEFIEWLWVVPWGPTFFAKATPTFQPSPSRLPQLFSHGFGSRHAVRRV